MRAHPDTERVLTSLQPGDTVAITSGILTRHGVVVDVDLDGIVVRVGGEVETVRVLSATHHDRMLPPDLQVSA